MKQIAKYQLIGVAPILMHSGQLSDPLNVWAKAIKRITEKKKKTDADHEEIGRLEWMGSLYLYNGAPCIPREAIKATLLRAGFTVKKGPKVKPGIVCEDHAMLEYEGPTDPKVMYEDGSFTHRATKAHQGKRVVRTRPIFFPWSAQVAIAFNDEMLNPEEVDELLKIAGSAIGFLEERPEYGRFNVHKF